jgi:hypothetical protein
LTVGVIDEVSSFSSFRFFKLRKFLSIIEVLVTLASFRIDETENKKVTSGLIGNEAGVSADLSDKILRALRLRLPQTGSISASGAGGQRSRKEKRSAHLVAFVTLMFGTFFVGLSTQFSRQNLA